MKTTTMKTLNQTATRIFLDLVQGLDVGQARKIDNAQGAFMAVSVDRLSENTYAIAHRYEQNGDLISDPDVEFYMVGCVVVVPLAIDQGPMGYHRYVELDNDQLTGARVAPRGQADLTSFCNTWLRNIKAQQRNLTPTPTRKAA